MRIEVFQQRTHVLNFTERCVKVTKQEEKMYQRSDKKIDVVSVADRFASATFINV